MWHSASVAVIVPAYMEERLIGRTLRTMPAYVDAIYVVDDASTDATSRTALAVGDPRIRLLGHPVNRGVGAAIVTGYQQALRDGADVLAVMAGDNQMHPDDLGSVLEPVVSGRAEYAKGNRFAHANARRMPAPRRLAGRALSALTRLATGLDTDDTQCGYTALSARAATQLQLCDLWPRFGYPNDLLGMLAARGMRVVDVPVRPVYAGEASGVRPWHVVVVASVILRRWHRTHRSPLVIARSRRSAG